MSYEFYKVLHILGLILAAAGVGATILQMQVSADRNFPQKKLALLAHGIGMVLLLVAGFGLMARISMMGSPWPTWIYIKLGVWLFFAASPSLAMRAPKAKLWIWWAVPAALCFAICSVVYKVSY